MNTFLAAQVSTPNISDQAWMLILIGVPPRPRPVQREHRHQRQAYHIIGIWFGRRIR